MQAVISVVWSYVCWYLRPLAKWFLHKTTKLCELQRICYGSKTGAERTCQVELCLDRSRTPSLKALKQHLYKLASEGKFHGDGGDQLVEFAVAGVIKIKRIKTSIHKKFLNSCGQCFDQLLGYRQLNFEVERLRRIPYSSENQVHEHKLLQLWMLLMPDVTLNSRISKQWSDIGFQGDNPMTDFRGMGLLGLDNLLYFAGNYTRAARHVLSHSHHPKYGYSFAIVGINLTSMAYTMLVNGALKTHIYNAVKGKPEVSDFHKVYCYLFYEFDKFWLAEKPTDIMEFNRIRNKFEETVAAALKLRETVFRINLAVDIV